MRGRMPTVSGGWFSATRSATRLFFTVHQPRAKMSTMLALEMKIQRMTKLFREKRKV